MRKTLALVAALALAAPLATGQASSANFKLASWGFASSGGGASAVPGAGWTNEGELSSGELLSPSFRAIVGNLGSLRPQMTTNVPTLFGINPPYAPKAGGSTITVYGYNFNALGSGASDVMEIGGNLVTGLTVLSNTVMTGTVPAGTGTNGGAGPQPVQIDNTFGSMLLPGAFINAPAVTSSPVALVGETIRLDNYGPTTAAFRCFVSTATTFANTKYGKLLIGPFPFYEILFFQLYPGPDGVQKLELDVPDDPILNGVTVYFQTLTITGLGPLTGSLTNSSTSTFP